ncbi:MAG: hypothetical protein A2V78_07290 [Betaproteobacteria bacterium RBG_16_64_18]|nr:MAG: hypothetical protein A2V78_07290 [Betaproteobacteria bacterium RBG_16_64_18]OGA12244.1 MAG: hypothetical protein A3H33_00540 [Betaproteobacteria bacterium RIFCSPLOWO2_02_FULL_65_20]OGA39548.1 MAG: hypothetical protein A3G26_03380 [Betaproteobacteria bacterium RIFCSPLOWO2_12_FULL_65_110]
MKRVAIDVGGTFTDCLVLDESGILQSFKSPTMPQDPSTGLLRALEKAAGAYRQTLAEFLGQVGAIIHGTTLATNALLTGRGVETGMITTKNFRDIIEIRRGIKNVNTSMYNFFVPPYRPLVPRRLRLGVEERTLWNGEIATELDESEVLQAAEQLRAKGVKAVAVCFLHSYANSANERRAVEICKTAMPGTHVTASHEILPVWREFERFSTTVVSAYIGPIVDDYLAELEKRLGAAGFRGTLLMMLSNGLTETATHCRSRAVFLIGSGPAAAPSAALHLGREMPNLNLLSVDMGGTSFDIGLIRKGEIPTTTEAWVGDHRVAIKMVDTRSVGAGGGSIAWVDSLGLLRVGPQSAGADPGPACYGKGGMEPTVSDADLLLGYIPDDYFLGGEIPLDAKLAEAAVKKVGDRLGLSVTETTQAIFTTVNSYMADSITGVSTKNGHDVRDFALVVGGGAGPVHGVFIADLLGIRNVIIPPVAALFSAFGMFVKDVGRDFSRPYFSPASRVDPDRVSQLFREMEEDARRALKAMLASDSSVVFTRTAEMRYSGQFHDIEVPVPGGDFTRQTLGATIDAFHARHEELYTFRMPWKEAGFLTFHLKATVQRAPFSLRSSRGTGNTSRAIKRERRCIFSGEQVKTPVYDGEKLGGGDELYGPAIIEERTTTVVIPQGYRCAVDGLRNYVLNRSS